MATFLLVHGSWHGAWCWDRVSPRLREHGHRVVAIDLPAHGEDRTSSFRASLGAYSRRIRSTAAGLPEKPVVVGHSMGGMAITQAASDEPGHFAALVYLCAFVPARGESLMMLGRLDDETLLREGIRFGVSGVRFRAEKAKSVFYGDCSDADAAWAAARLRPDPWLPLFQGYRERQPVTLPRAYIACTRDRAISLARQRAMADRAAFDRVVALETDHSPFLSRPAELAAHLHDMARLAARAG